MLDCTVSVNVLKKVIGQERKKKKKKKSGDFERTMDRNSSQPCGWKPLQTRDWLIDFVKSLAMESAQKRYTNQFATSGGLCLSWLSVKEGSRRRAELAQNK
jgi:hypothetical protein